MIRITPMLRTLGPLFLAALAIGTGGCSSCTTSRGLKQFPTVEIVEPADGFELTRDNDLDGDFTNSLQLRVVVNATALKPGETIRLEACRAGETSCPASVTGELAAVEGADHLAVSFTLTPPTGAVTLQATYTFAGGATIHDNVAIAVEAIELPTLSILAPQDGARLDADDDADGNLFNGFQTDVSIQTQNVPDGQMVRLIVDDRPFGQLPLVGGAATFEAVELPEAPDPPGVSIRAETQNVEGDQAGATIRVLVDTGRCRVSLAPAPVEAGCDFVVGSDEAPETGWVERTFTVESNCETVTLTLNGAQLGDPKPVVDGRATFLVPLEQVDGVPDEHNPRLSNTLRVSANSADGRFGSTPPASYIADTLPPTLTIEPIVGGGPAGELLPADDDAPEQDGLQFDIRGEVCGVQEGAAVTVTITDAAGQAVGAPVAAEVLPPAPGDACLTWRVLDHTATAPGTFTVTAATQDACGTPGSVEGSFTADFIVPTLTISAPADGTVFGVAADDDGDVANGLQTVVQVASTGLDEGAPVFIERADPPVNPDDVVIFGVEGMEDAVGTAGAGDDPREIRIPVTLTAGRHLLRARYAGTNPAVSDPVEVTAVLTTPTIAFFPAPPARTALPALTVCVVTADVPVGSPVTLTVNDADLPAAAPVADDLGACFADVALVEGENTLSATVADLADQVAETGPAFVVVDRIAPQLAFVAPAGPSPELAAADDKDGDLSNGFTYDVVVQVIDADPDLDVVLTVTQDDSSDEHAPAAVDGDQFTFRDVPLGPGAYTLRATAADSVLNAAEASVEVTVTLNAPRVQFVALADNRCIADGAGFEVTLSATVDGIPLAAGTARVTVSNPDGSEGITAPRDVVDGLVTFGLFLQDGTSSLRGRVDAGEGMSPGFTLPKRVTVKSRPPTLAFVSPPAGFINLQAADDGPGVAGFQKTIVVSGQDLSAGFNASLVVDCGQGPGPARTAAAVGGQFTFAAVDLVEGVACTATATVEDCTGRVSEPVAATWTVDRTPPTFAFSRPRNGTRLGFLDDLSAVVAGLQFNVQCDYTDVDPAAPITLTIDPAPPQGQPGPVMPGRATGTALFSNVTLLDGDDVRLTCSGRDPAGNPAQDTISTVVRVGAPQISWAVPSRDDTWNVLDDLGAAAGLQGSISINALNVPDGVTIEVCTDLHGGAGAACDRPGWRVAAAAATVAQRAELRAVPLAEGQHTLYARAVMDGAAPSPDLRLFVDSVAPRVLSLNPVCDADANGLVGLADDADPDAAGFQCDVRVRLEGDAQGVEDGQVITLLTSPPETAVGSALAAGNDATIRVTFPRGVYPSVFARTTDRAGNPNAGPAANPLNELGPFTVDLDAPTVAFSAPAAGATLLAAADLEADKSDGDGEFEVRVTTSGAPASLAFAVDGQARATVQPVVGVSTSQHLVLQEGQRTLRATATDAARNSASAEVAVTVAPRLPTLEIRSPAPGTVFAAADDLDPNRGGLQIDVHVCTTNLAAGRPLTVSSTAGGEVGDDATVGGDGCATVRCTLPPGQQDLQAAGSDVFGNANVSPAVSVEVEVVGCGLTINQPASNPAYVNLATDKDADPANGGQLDIAVIALNVECDGLQAELVVDDVVAGVARMAQGAARFDDVTLAEGAHSVLVRVILEGSPSESADKTIHVDLSAPTVAFTAPAASPATLRVADDLDPGVANLQYDFRLNVAGGQGGRLTLTDAVAGELAARADLPADAAQTFAGVTVAQGARTLTARVTDPAGNAGTAVMQAVVDSVAPAAPGAFTATLVDRRRPSVRLDWTEPGDDEAGGGPVTSYDVRYSAAAITEDNFEDACLADAPAPAGAGVAAEQQVDGPGPEGACALRTGLPDSGGAYHFAVRAVDDVGNVSPVAATGQAVQARWRVQTIRGPVGATAFGAVLAKVHDIDGDGFDDFAVSSWSIARAWMVYGAPGDELNDMAPVEITPAGAADRFGFGLAGVGDANGDGLPDLLVLSRFRAYLFAGSRGQAMGNVPLQEFSLEGDGVCPQTASSVGAIGNFDGDLTPGGRPLNDMAIGCSRTGGPGAVYIVRGRTNWPGGVLAISTDDGVNAANGVTRVVGDLENGRFGASVGEVGDSTGDGRPEILIGANAANSGAGAAYLVRGRSPLQPVITTLSPGVTLITGPDLGNANFGLHVAGGVDLTGDATPDFSVQVFNSRRVHVFDGANPGLGVARTIARDVEKFGHRHAFADLNGDGRADMVSGTLGPDEASIAYHAEGLLQQPSTIFGNVAAQFGRAIAVCGDVTGEDGLPDFVVASQGQDAVYLYH